MGGARILRGMAGLTSPRTQGAFRARIGIVVLAVGAWAMASPAWAASGWHTTTTPNPGVNFAYQSRSLNGVVAFSATNAWAVGNYSRASGGGSPLILHWTGNAWHPVKPPAPAGASGSLRFLSANGPSDIWALGNQDSSGAALYLLHSDGQSWHAVSTSGVAATFSAWSLGVDTPTSIWIGGYDVSSSRPMAEHWDGQRWTATMAPLPAGAQGGQLSGIAIIPGTHRPLAVGYVDAASRFSPYAAEWSSGAWHPMPTPKGKNAELRAVVMTSANSAWAVGTSYPNNQLYETFAEHWNGKVWTTVATVNRAAASNTLIGITANGPKDVWAVGYTSGCGGRCVRSLAEHFNGKQWSLSTTPDPSLGNDTSDEFWDAAVVPRTAQVWAVGTHGPARPADSAEFTFAARAN